MYINKRLAQLLSVVLAFMLIICSTTVSADADIEALSKWYTFDPLYYPTLSKGANGSLSAKCQKSANTSILYYTPEITPSDFSATLTVDHISNDGWFGFGLTSKIGNSMTDPEIGGKGFMLMLRKSSIAGKADVTLFTVIDQFAGPFGGTPLSQVDIGTSFTFSIEASETYGYTLKINGEALVAMNGTVAPDLSILKNYYSSHPSVRFRLAGCGNGIPNATGSDSAEFHVNSINGIAPFLQHDVFSRFKVFCEDLYPTLKRGQNNSLIAKCQKSANTAILYDTQQNFSSVNLTIDYLPQNSWFGMGLSDKIGNSITDPVVGGKGFFLMFERAINIEKANVTLFSINQTFDGPFGGIPLAQVDIGTAFTFSVEESETYGYSLKINGNVLAAVNGTVFPDFSDLKEMFDIAQSPLYLKIAGCGHGTPGAVGSDGVEFTINQINSVSPFSLTNTPQQEHMLDNVVVGQVLNTIPNAIQLLPDPTFANGFDLVSSSSSSVRGSLAFGKQMINSMWKLTQFHSKYYLDGFALPAVIENRVSYANMGKRIYREMNADNSVTLGMAVYAATEYDSPRTQASDPWVHLMAESYISPTPLSDYNNIILKLDTKVPLFENYMSVQDYNSNIMCAQMNAYFIIRNQNPSSAGYISDWFWLGLNLYDNRYTTHPGTFMIDQGFSGATDVAIYSPNGNIVYGNQTPHDGLWHSIHVDIKAQADNALQRIKQEGHYMDTLLSDLQIDAFFLSWEVSGNFNCEILMKNIGLYGV